MIKMPVEAPVTQWLFHKASMAGVPLSGTFEVSPLCNMDCKMCYVRLSRQQQEAIRPLATAEQWLALAQRLKAAGMLYLLITGGEPFAYPGIRTLLEGLHKMGLLVSVNSNGTCIDEETVQWLKAVPPVRINLTLYGASDETYARLCQNPHGFTQATRAVKLLRQAGIGLRINCSITPQNARDLEKIVAYTKENNLLFQPTAYMFPPVRKDPSMVGQNDRFTPEQAAYYTAYAEYLQYGKEQFFLRPDNAALPPEPEEHCLEVGEGIRCRAGKCSFWITWEGKLLPCGMFPTEGAPNVFQTDFSAAWEQLKTQTAAIRLPNRCARCQLKESCRSCAAMVVTESGCFEKAPQYRCDMMAAYAGQRRRIKEEMQ